MSHRPFIFALPLLVALAACGNDPSTDETTESEGPVVTEVSLRELTVGEPLFFRGRDLVPDDAADGVARLRFVGRFHADDGTVRDVDFTVSTVYHATLEGGDQVVRWPRFGPFDNPFAPDVNTPGTFSGRIIATSFDPSDGSEYIGEESDEIELRVQASVVIEALQPLVADCGAPAIRGLQGLPYEMVVRAVGFAPASFRYELENVNGQSLAVYEHPATGPTDRLGWAEPFVFNPVAEGDAFYATTLRVIATDARGRSVETALPYTVHRPLEVRYDGELKVGQYFPPVPVTGCIPGQIGNRVTYSETQSETRQQAVSVTVSNNWSRSNGVTNTQSFTEGYAVGQTNSSSVASNITEAESQSSSEAYGVTHNESEANRFDFSSTDGENWGYSVDEGQTSSERQSRHDEVSANAEVSASVTAGGEVGIPIVANGSASVTAGTKVGAGYSHGWGSETSTGRSYSEGYNTGGSVSESTSFGSVTTEGSSNSFSGSYALTSQSSQSRSLSDTESRSSTRTYNMGSGVSESEVVSEGMTEAESSTWVESSTSSTLTSYSGVIPVGRYGVFYRQTIRMTRVADVYAFDLCGVAEKHSEMVFNEWTWAPDLAIGAECGATLPPSGLPQAECFVQPCWN